MQVISVDGKTLDILHLYQMTISCQGLKILCQIVLDGEERLLSMSFLKANTGEGIL